VQWHASKVPQVVPLKTRLDSAGNECLSGSTLAKAKAGTVWAPSDISSPSLKAVLPTWIRVLTPLSYVEQMSSQSSTKSKVLLSETEAFGLRLFQLFDSFLRRD